MPHVLLEMKDTERINCTVRRVESNLNRASELEHQENAIGLGVGKNNNQQGSSKIRARKLCTGTGLKLFTRSG